MPDGDHHTLALLAPLVVARRRELPRHATVEDEHLDSFGQLDVAGLQAPAVDEQRASFVRRRDDQLVHETAANADEVVLDLPPQLRQLEGLEDRARQPAEREEDPDLERGGGRQPEPSGRSPSMSRSAPGTGHPERTRTAAAPDDVLRPGTPRRRLERRDRPLRHLPVPHRRHPQHTVVTPTSRDRRTHAEGERQHQAVVVVGVLADQVPRAPATRSRSPARLRRRPRRPRSPETIIPSRTHGATRRRPPG